MNFTEVKAAIAKECDIKEELFFDIYQQYKQPTEAQIAAALAVDPSLDPKKVDGDPLPWVKGFIKEHRLAVVMHMDTHLALEANPDLNTLKTLEVQLVHPEDPIRSYKRYVVVMSTKMLARR